MTNGLRKGSLPVLVISLYWKKRFSREHPKNQMLIFGLAQTSHFGLWDIIYIQNVRPDLDRNYLTL